MRNLEKALAKELDVPVLALFNYQDKLNKGRTKNSAFRSQRVRVDRTRRRCGHVCFREQYYLEKQEPKPGTAEHVEWQKKMSQIHNEAEIIIGKQRHGPTGVIKLEFESAFTKFKDVRIKNSYFLKFNYIPIT